MVKASTTVQKFKRDLIVFLMGDHGYGYGYGGSPGLMCYGVRAGSAVLV